MSFNTDPTTSLQKLWRSLLQPELWQRELLTFLNLNNRIAHVPPDALLLAILSRYVYVLASNLPPGWLYPQYIVAPSSLYVLFFNFMLAKRTSLALYWKRDFIFTSTHQYISTRCWHRECPQWLWRASCELVTGWTAVILYVHKQKPRRKASSIQFPYPVWVKRLWTVATKPWVLLLTELWTAYVIRFVLGSNFWICGTCYGWQALTSIFYRAILSARCRKINTGLVLIFSAYDFCQLIRHSSGSRKLPPFYILYCS